MTSPALPPAIRWGLLLLPAGGRGRVRSLAEWFAATAREMQALLLADGARFRDRAMALSAHPPAVLVDGLGLPPAKVRTLLDGLTVHLSRQRHRDRAQLDAVLLQTGGTLAELGASLLGADAANADARRAARQFGRAIAQAELLHRLHEGFAVGRVHIPESEIERFGADIDGMAQGRVSPRALDLLWSEAKHARALLDEACGALDWIPPGGARRFALLLVERERDILRRLEAAEWRFAGMDPELRGMDALRLVWRMRRA